MVCNLEWRVIIASRVARSALPETPWVLEVGWHPTVWKDVSAVARPTVTEGTIGLAGREAGAKQNIIQHNTH